MKPHCLLSLLPLLALPACSLQHAAPKTILQFNPATHQVTITSPKDIDIGGMTFTWHTNGEVALTLTNYTSHNNPAVVQALAEYNTAMQKAYLEAGAKMLGTAISAAAK